MKISENHYKSAIRISRILIKKYLDELNKINVFPVPDGDTGTNLFLTLDGIWKKVRKIKYNHFGKFSEVVADAAFESAVGNSGNILASFLYGIYDYSKSREYLEVNELIEAFEVGTKYAYESVENPREGTILTAMRVSVDVAKTEIKNGNQNLASILRKCISKSLEELKRRKCEIPELLKYDVIDAGGLGFILILKSWSKGLSEQFILELTKKKIEVKYEGKYCVNILLELNSKSKFEIIKNKLEKIGQSIVIRKFRNKLKIHIHVDDVEKVKEVLKNYGKILKVSISSI